MSGQFEQRRLARPSYQLEVLDRFCGEEQLRRRAEARAAWRELLAARRRHEELTENAALAEARLAELRALVEDTEGMEPGDEERLRDERERAPPRRRSSRRPRPRRPTALAPEEGEGAAGLVALAERAVAPLERLAPELAARRRRAARRRAAAARDRVRACTRSSPRSRPSPGRLEELEAGLDRIAEREAPLPLRDATTSCSRAPRRRAPSSTRSTAAPILPRRPPRRSPPPRRASHALCDELRAERNAAAPAFADAVAAELHDVGMGEGEFVCELREREPGSTGADEAVFLVRPNAGLPFAPVAETASGGELSRIALAIAAVAGGETLVFDEIDAGIGGETANAVGRVLRRLAERAQVITITHLPQIAALADRHFRVEKIPGDPTHTRIEQLGDDERQAELERMLGGQEFLATVRDADAERVLLAPIDDVWAFLAEPYHLADWWPGISGVEPDRRGLAPGARWKVHRAEPPRLLPQAAGDRACCSSSRSCRASGSRSSSPATGSTPSSTLRAGRRATGPR